MELNIGLADGKVCLQETDGADVTFSGSAFHASAPATRKARSPSCVASTTTEASAAERSR